MMLRLTRLCLAAVLLAGCTKHVRTSSHISLSGPALGPGGAVLANTLTLSYEVEAPEEVHLIADGKRVHTATLSGKGTWKIEAASGKLHIAGPGVSLAVPVAGEGDIKSDMTRNSAGQLVFDISLGGKKVMQLECPTRPGAGSP